MAFSSDLQMSKMREDELVEQLQIVQYDISDERAAGILRQIFGKGFDSLSKKQNYIYEKYISPIVQERFQICLSCCQTIDTENSFLFLDELGIEFYICENCEYEHMKD